MEKENTYLSSELPVEERVEDLLGRMTLEEKASQLKARMAPLASSGGLGWKMLFKPFEGLSEDQRKRLEESMISMFFGERAIMESLSVNYWRKHWREVVVEEGKYGIGQLSMALRPFSPKESAEFAGEMQKFVLEKTRLGIPVMIHDESLHGCMAKGCTIFPQAIALASSWDPNLMRQVSTVIGKETRAHGIHQCLSPTVNIARDPRCGRTEETYGEDPYLVSIMAVSFVEGVQSQKVVATPKHFVANFVGDGGRDSNEVHFSERILREIYFPAFKASLKAGALSLMPAYNAIDGVPCSCSKELLTNLLRGEWGFKGLAVSDYFAVVHLYTKHKVAGTKAEAAKKALEAGMDMELPESDCFEEIQNLVKEGRVSEKIVDEAVRRILRVKFWLGLFDNPYVEPDHAEKVCDCEEHRELALKAARKTMVLLKNDGILPLSKSLKSIAVIGPNANKLRLGKFSSYGVQVVTPLEGIRNKVCQDTRIYFAEGCKLTGGSDEGFEEAVKIAKNSSIAILFVGNSVPQTEGEGNDRCNLDLPGIQEDLVKKICDTGTPVVVVLTNGSAITMIRWIDKVKGLIEAWYPGEEGGNAIAEVLFGDYNPGGKLPITFPKTVGQLPLYYNHKPTGRVDDYVDLRGKQYLFPFGYGLSYTKFKYSNLTINPKKISPDEEININVDVENAGEYEGDEVVQLYLHDAVSSLAKPVKELKRFRRITLEPGEKKKVSFTLTSTDLLSYDADMNLVIEPGIFEVMLGASSEDIRLKGNFKIK